jgi:hypothetical protein
MIPEVQFTALLHMVRVLQAQLIVMSRLDAIGAQAFPLLWGNRDANDTGIAGNQFHTGE